MNDLPQTLQTQLQELRAKHEAEVQAEAKSTIDAYYEPLIDAKRQEVHDLERQRQEALEMHQLDPQRIETNGYHRSTSPQDEASPLSHNNVAARNGSPKLPARRVMVEAVLPSLRGRGFIRRDIEAKIIEKWPKAEPKTDAESANFTSGIAGLLSDLVKKGKLEVSIGETGWEPRVYRVKEDQEEELTLGP